jgi:hypothetical protein
VAFNPLNSDELIGLWTYKGYIVRSADGGLTWDFTGCSNPVQRYGCVFWSSVDTNRVYAGRMGSLDGGATWTDVGRFVISMSSANPDVLVGLDTVQRSVTNQALAMYLSLDGGASWVNLPDPPSESVPGLDNTYWGVVTSASTWGRQAASRIAIDPSGRHDPAVSSTNRVRVLLAGRSGIYEYNAGDSNGGGISADWMLRSDGLEPNSHYSVSNPVPWMGLVAFDSRPGHELTVYAAKTMDNQTLGEWSEEQNANHAYPGGDNFEPFYRSANGGVSWEKLHGDEFPGAPFSAMIHDLRVDERGRLFAATCEGLFVFSGAQVAEDDYEIWQQQYSWDAAEDAAPSADPDGDGELNLLEYAVGSNPLSSDSLFSPELQVTSDSVPTYMFFRASSQLKYSVMQSTNLIDWTEAVVPAGPGGAVVHWPCLSGLDRLFIRLQISDY